MRRVIKPFAVEVRRGGKQQSATSINVQPAWTALIEAQEPAQRPAEPVAAVPEPDAPPGRILPALDEPEPSRKAMPVKRKRRRRVDTEPVPDWIGEEAGAVSVEIEPEKVASVATPSAEKARTRAGRLARSHFGPGERWKARLPVSRIEHRDETRRSRR